MIKFLTDLRARFRLLPLLIVVASLAFIVRIGDAASEFRALSNEAIAAEKESAATQDTKPKDATASAQPPAEPPAEPPAQPDVKAPSVPEAPDTTSGEKIMPDASDTDIDNSALREDVYKDLLARRQQIEAKEQELAKREALITAATKEVDQKVRELTALRDEIQGLLKKQSGEEQANTQRLVKIYEGMKPKDAARIFNTLDMDILLDVVSNMSERKSAPIIAQMDPERARSLTLFLAEQRQLPKESDIPANASAANPTAAQ
jgi:flagellar motility protein MotE (MotC chaperone)